MKCVVARKRFDRKEWSKSFRKWQEKPGKYEQGKVVSLKCALEAVNSYITRSSVRFDSLLELVLDLPCSKFVFFSVPGFNFGFCFSCVCSSYDCSSLLSVVDRISLIESAESDSLATSNLSLLIRFSENGYYNQELKLWHHFIQISSWNEIRQLSSLKRFE